MKRAAKGSSGYIRYEKVKRGLIALLMFAIPLVIFFTGLITTGTRKNLLTVVAILGILPAARFAVSWIMIMLQKPAPDEVVDATQKAAPDLVKAYELTVTAYEGRMPLDAVAVRSGSVICLSLNGKKEQFAFMEKHMETILAQNGYRNVKVKIFADEKSFLERVKSMQHAEDTEAGKSSQKTAADGKTSASRNGKKSGGKMAVDGKTSASQERQKSDGKKTADAKTSSDQDEENMNAFAADGVDEADVQAPAVEEMEQSEDSNEPAGLNRDEKILAVIKAISL